MEGRCTTLSTGYRYRIVGNVIWRHTLRLIPFSDIYELIDVLRRAGIHQRETCWDDKNFRLTIEEKAVIQKAYQELQRNDYICNPVFECQDEVILASDSSDLRWGFIKLSGEHEEEGTHIFIKELIAAVWTIKRFLKNRRCIVIAIDNTAAAHMQYSTCIPATGKGSKHLP